LNLLDPESAAGVTGGTLGIGVSVGGTGVAVGGTGVAVGGIGVAVGGTGVSVGGTGVCVGGIGVTVAGIGVAVAVAVGSASVPHAASITSAKTKVQVRNTKRELFIAVSFMKKTPKAGCFRQLERDCDGVRRFDVGTGTLCEYFHYTGRR
jgi:hypothetical protein